jgi:hypothetical protein
MEYTAVTPHAYVPSQPAVKSSQPQDICTFALQSYKISERNAKENLFSFHFRTKSKFGEAKDIK